MSLAKVTSVGVNGIDGYTVTVEADVSGGLPAFETVGLADTSIKESKERVKSAIKNSGFIMRSHKITANLAPASVKKEGTHYDLPLAVAVLSALGFISPEGVSEFVILGELSLYGDVRGVRGVLPMADKIKKLGYDKLIVPYENRNESCLVSGLKIYPVKSLNETVDLLNDKENAVPYVNNKDYFEDSEKFILDFADVQGQENAKRALEIACAGGHSCLMVGSPGSGKTMLAKRVPYILPSLTHKEAIDVTKLYSVSGLVSDETPLITKRPFRIVHHTVSPISLVGGGAKAVPGEISLAHNGVLFMDEIPEFKRQTLEVLRQPMEDKEITVTRVLRTATYPCNFMIIAAMNPCPCGYMGSDTKECKCSLEEIRRYQKKISGPLLDRIDLQIEVPAVKYSDLLSKERREGSKEVKERVMKARKMQYERYKNEGITTNSQLTSPLIEKYIKISEGGKQLLEQAFDKLALSARGYTKIVKVARTVADLEGSEEIDTKHIAEAIGYRDISEKYFG